jgi:uncharacterized protein YecE (DUF72 family)
MPAKKHFHIGCSGYYYPAWKNNFYPEGLPSKEWLTYYSSVFNTVEINATFYRSPKANDLKRYASVTPKNFTFSAKMHKFLTHNKKLLNCKNEILAYQDLITEGLGEKLACFLFQMPPAFHYTDENLERLLNNIPNSVNNVVELRHLSWWNEEVVKAFKKSKLTFCNVDFPGMKTYVVETSPLFYFRFHGNPVLFTSKYDLKVLKKYSRQFPENARKNFIYFNNTAGAAGYTNALQLKDIVNA